MGFNVGGLKRKSRNSIANTLEVRKSRNSIANTLEVRLFYVKWPTRHLYINHFNSHCITTTPYERRGVTGGFPSHRASNAENVSMTPSCKLHVFNIIGTYIGGGADSI